MKQTRTGPNQTKKPGMNCRDWGSMTPEIIFFPDEQLTANVRTHINESRERLVIKAALLLVIFVFYTIHAMVELTLITGEICNRTTAN